ncbi:hypothetical protein MGN70_007394 [Eutypa lata]|nr:hypothetical protein MGN70_007394 [Eutypa lata]
MYTAKLPLIFLLIRTFGIEMWLRRTCQALVIIGLLGFLGSAIYTGISCSPALNVVSPLYLFKCITAVTQGTITRGSVSLMMDVVLFFLPLKVIKKLHLPLRRKIGLGLVFMTGLAAIAASSLGVYFQVAQSEGTSSNFANALLITVLESAIVILVSCAPSLHLFWTQQAYSLRMRLGLVSRMSMSTTPKTKSGSSTRATIRHSVRHTPKESVSMSSGPIQVTTHHYVELRDLPGSDAVEKPAAAYGAYEAKASRNWDQV